METLLINGAAIAAARLAVLDELQNEEVANLYCDTLSEIATFITEVDDPDLPARKQLGWLQVIAAIKSDLKTLSKID